VPGNYLQTRGMDWSYYGAIEQVTERSEFACACSVTVPPEIISER